MFSAVLSKSGARGRGYQKKLSEKHQKTAVFHSFSGSDSFGKIRGPGVGALAGNNETGQDPGKVSSRTPFLLVQP